MSNNSFRKRSFSNRLFAEKPNIIEVVHVIERANTNPTFSERCVFDAHVGRFHVVKEDLNFAIGRLASQFDAMPLIVPWDSFFVFRHRLSRSFVDDHDLAAGGVWLGAQVHVIKLFSILVAEKDTTIAMIPCISGAFDVKSQHEIGNLYIAQQCDIQRTPMWWRVLAFATTDPKDVVAVLLLMVPSGRVGCFPAIEAFLKVVAKNQRQFLAV